MTTLMKLATAKYKYETPTGGKVKTKEGLDQMFSRPSSGAKRIRGSWKLDATKATKPETPNLLEKGKWRKTMSGGKVSGAISSLRDRFSR